MIACELAGFWSAVAAYAGAFVAAAFALVLGRPGWLRAAVAAGWAGFAAQGLALVCRGFGQWSPPFITYYESILFGTWLSTGIALGMAARNASFRPALAVVPPVALLLMGSSVFSSRAFAPLAPSLQSWWLVVHVVFALLAFACTTTAAVAAAMTFGVLGRRWTPRGDVVDSVLFKALALAFVFQLVMVAAGSIWANQAWGRYWGWDPIESFSLVTLIVLALALHLRMTLGWKGRPLAVMALAGFAATVYGIWGVPVFFPSMHLYQGPAGPGGG